MKTFTQLNENNFKPKKHTFNIFLSLIDKYKNIFIHNNNINLYGYYYFFMTDKITNKQELLNDLKLLKSLKNAYMTYIDIIDNMVYFYFAIKDYTLEYGFFDDTDNKIYKIGEFKINNTYLKTIKSPCININIKKLLHRLNLKNLNLLYEGFEKLKSFLTTGESKVLDENRIVKIIKKEDIDASDINTDDVYKYFVNYFKFEKWYYNFYYYMNYKYDYCYFYMKVRNDNSKFIL